MSEVTLKINGRGYGLACDEGQEQRLSDLAHYVDGRLRDIADAGAATNDSHLFVLTALVLADEVFEMRDEVRALRDHVRSLQENPKAVADEFQTYEKQVAGKIEGLAEKILQISSRIENKSFKSCDVEAVA